MTKDKYCYHGLLWFGQGEDVKIFNSDSGEELLEYTLDELIDEIEISIPETEYDITSPYYMDKTTEGIRINARDYFKLHDVPCYGTAYYMSTGWTCIMYVSLDPEGVMAQAPWGDNSYYGPIAFRGKDWYISGPGAALSGDNLSLSNPKIYGAYAPDPNYSNDISTDAVIQFLTNVHDYKTGSPYYMEESGEFALLYYYSRTYYKLNEGPAYAFCCYDGTDTHAILISLESNNTVYRVNNYQPPANTFTVTFNSKTWYVDGFAYSEPGNYSTSSSHYIDISSGAPYASQSDIALTLLQMIYGS